jgi:hypothetical protein
MVVSGRAFSANEIKGSSHHTFSGYVGCVGCVGSRVPGLRLFQVALCFKVQVAGFAFPGR